MISDEKRDYTKAVLGSRIESREREEYKKALRVEAHRDALITLLSEFDAFCNEKGIAYFVFSDTLQGAVVYQDFIPGDDGLSVGMQYSEVKKLEAFFADGDFEIPGAIPWKFQDGPTGSKKVCDRLNPRIQGYMCEPVLADGQELFDKDSLVMMVENPYFTISVFYSVPGDFFTMKEFFNRMDKKNRIAKKVDRVHDGKPTRNPLLYLIQRDKFVEAVQKMAGEYEGRSTEKCCRVLNGRSKVVDRSFLDNRRRVTIRGVEAWAPGEGDPWTHIPVLSDPPDDLKYLQKRALEVASEIHRVCKKLGIGYFACGGTMLGYVRDGGFIPWDDDIDVGMLRADYERFLKEAPSVIDGDKFFLQTRQSDPNIPYLFSKIRMNGTLYVTEYNQFRDFHKGICVDIFPFDEVPNTASGQAAFKKKITAISKRHNRIANAQFGVGRIEQSDGAKTLDHAVSHLKGRAKWASSWHKSLTATQEEYDKAVTRYSHSADRDNCEYVASFVPTYTMIRKDNLLPYREVDFSGIKLNVPAQPEIFLAMQYGDYMTLPPMHNRVGHNLIEWGDEK